MALVYLTSFIFLIALLSQHFTICSLRDLATRTLAGYKPYIYQLYEKCDSLDTRLDTFSAQLDACNARVDGLNNASLELDIANMNSDWKVLEAEIREINRAIHRKHGVVRLTAH